MLLLKIQSYKSYLNNNKVDILAWFEHNILQNYQSNSSFIINLMFYDNKLIEISNL